MTYAGAQGQTATEMATALHYGAAAGSIFDGQNALSQALASRAASALSAAQQLAQNNQQPAPSASDYDLQVVNSVWGEQTYPWAQPFLTTLARSYGTGVYLEDFVHAWDPARQAINAWVSDATSDKINDLLAPGALDDATRMVLVNAVHLKLPWAFPFQVAATALASFTRADGSTVSVPFMNESEELPYVDDGTAQIVALPLVGSQVSVVIAMPHGDLATYEAALTAATPNALAPPAATAQVQLSLPKMSFTSPTFSLASSLQAMGMVQAFDPGTANFSGMCPTTPDGANLHVADVLQKAMVAMQETGVEAAAATAVLLDASIAPESVPMAVNRPFRPRPRSGPRTARHGAPQLQRRRRRRRTAAFSAPNPVDRRDPSCLIRASCANGSGLHVKDGAKTCTAVAVGAPVSGFQGRTTLHEGLFARIADRRPSPRRRLLGLRAGVRERVRLR
ncbi:MAG: serpin family protein [Polyangiaceae bacterium]